MFSEFFVSFRLLSHFLVERRFQVLSRLALACLRWWWSSSYTCCIIVWVANLKVMNSLMWDRKQESLDCTNRSWRVSCLRHTELKWQTSEAGTLDSLKSTEAPISLAKRSLFRKLGPMMLSYFPRVWWRTSRNRTQSWKCPIWSENEEYKNMLFMVCSADRAGNMWKISFSWFVELETLIFEVSKVYCLIVVVEIQDRWSVPWDSGVVVDDDKTVDCEFVVVRWSEVSKLCFRGLVASFIVAAINFYRLYCAHDLEICYRSYVEALASYINV